LQARQPAKPARHSPEAQPMADGQGEAAWGAECAAVVNYCKRPATQKMRSKGQSRRVQIWKTFFICVFSHMMHRKNKWSNA